MIYHVVVVYTWKDTNTHKIASTKPLLAPQGRGRTRGGCNTGAEPGGKKDGGKTVGKLWTWWEEPMENMENSDHLWKTQGCFRTNLMN